MADACEKSKKYLFITGVSRSGTTVMADLLRSHHKIAMGRERYAHRYRKERDLNPGLFSKKRFCLDYHPEDSHHKMMQPYYGALYHYFDECIYVGDKLPYMAQDYGPLLAYYERPKVVYMARDIFEVALSFEARARSSKENPERSQWPKERGWEAAVDEWNKSIRATLDAAAYVDLLVVDYSRLFKDSSLVDEIFSFLALDATPSVYRFYDEASVKRNLLDRDRASCLSSQQRASLEKNARFDLFQELLQIAG